ncbi:hypothetical protein EYF80_064256 [Liparis tanakae]|uniref:Uncharacterized protein n=1 Tax=Liparis tanakae TaxID=230148 RepID=A0A4Z2EAP8_9TELE|nr:hypothetical protein EYF80_064256 [Liparis tanakae]
MEQNNNPDAEKPVRPEGTRPLGKGTPCEPSKGDLLLPSGASPPAHLPEAADPVLIVSSDHSSSPEGSQEEH